MTCSENTEYRIASANQVLASPLERTSAGKTLEAGGFSLEVSGAASSTTNYAATSQAMAKASQHLDRILKEQDEFKVRSSEISFAKFLEKVEMVPEHETREDLAPYTMTIAEWELAEIAVMASSFAYEKLPSMNVQQRYKIIQEKGGLKATVAHIDDWSGKPVLVFGIRGTVTKNDWARNLNSGMAIFHRGFLKTAEAMELEMIRIVREFQKEGRPFDSILLAGHSLGGTLAQIFYHFAHDESTKLYRALPKAMPISCITFGAPPVSSAVIAARPPGYFLSFANEGDLVVRAQESYIKQLLEIYALPIQYVQKKLETGFAVDEPFFRLSGKCIVLKGILGTGGAQHEAYDIKTAELERAFFGNVKAHCILLYVQRVNYLTERARVTEDKIREGSEDE